MMDAIEMIKGRRSVRTYRDEKVDRELLAKIVEVSRWSPSWGNLQIARYTFVDNAQMIEAIYSRGVKGFGYNMKTLKNTRSLLVLSYVQGKSGKLDGVNYATEKGAEWEMFDAGIACQTFCLAAHAYGVGSCIFGVIDDGVISEIVGLPEGETVAAVITLGYEEGDTTVVTPRKEVEKLMRFAEL
ncbi:MAG: nitroreductase family protein [Rikenellaceae bacterium]